MTGYFIEIGYNSGSVTQEQAWNRLKAVVATLRQDTDAIMAEVMRENPRFEADYESGVLREYAERYSVADDLTCYVVEPKEDEVGYIGQCASGGEPGRTIKEAMRRAFCRLVIFEMHKLGIEVSMRVS